MDDTDWAIVRALRENAKTSNVDLAKALNLSEGAVRHRIQLLEQNKAIQRYTILSGAGANGVVAIKCNPKTPTNQVVRQLQEIGAARIAEIAGEFDVLCWLEARSPSELNDLIEKIRVLKDVKEARLFTVLKQH